MSAECPVLASVTTWARSRRDREILPTSPRYAARATAASARGSSYSAGLAGHRAGRAGQVVELGLTRRKGRREMTDRTYRVTEIVGTSPDGVEPAIQGALTRAAQTLRHLDWFEVTQIRGQIVDGDVAHFQVGLKVGFRLEDS